MALDPCPHCNREFEHSNAGARQNHVDACPYNPKNMPEAAGGSEAGGPQKEPDPEPVEPPAAEVSAASGSVEVDPTPEQPTQPARVDDHQDAGLPAMADTNAIEAGLTAAPAVDSLIGGTRGDKLKTIAGVLAAAGDHFTRQDEMARERSRQYAGQTVQPVEDAPLCHYCDAPITQLPDPGVEFACPYCGGMLRSP